MVTPQSWNYNYDEGYDYDVNSAEKISSEEYEVIYKFLESYKNQNIIVADRFAQNFRMVPLNNQGFSFKKSEETSKYVTFCRRIYHKEKEYFVELDLSRREDIGENLNCLMIHNFIIRSFEENNIKDHFIELSTDDRRKKNILFQIINIFDERKIISPEKEYCKYMYAHSKLQSLMLNHEWEKIDSGVKQMPSLASSLFKISEESKCHGDIDAYFGTILYHLISFRENNLNSFDEKDLDKLDKLILKLSKTKLLKVQLSENMKLDESTKTASILLYPISSTNRFHSSDQYNVSNTLLTKERKILNKIIIRNNQN